MSRMHQSWDSCLSARDKRLGGLAHLPGRQNVPCHARMSETTDSQAKGRGKREKSPQELDKRKKKGHMLGRNTVDEQVRKYTHRYTHTHTPSFP